MVRPFFNTKFVGQTFYFSLCYDDFVLSRTFITVKVNIFAYRYFHNFTSFASEIHVNLISRYWHHYNTILMQKVFFVFFASFYFRDFMFTCEIRENFYLYSKSINIVFVISQRILLNINPLKSSTSCSHCKLACTLCKLNKQVKNTSDVNNCQQRELSNYFVLQEVL